MSNPPLGNEAIRQALGRLVESGRIPHCMLFSGPEGVGKSLFGKYFASLLFGAWDRIDSGNHPDLLQFQASGRVGMHSMESIRQLSQEIALFPHEAPWRVVLVHDAERMLPSSANALLKTLEEPSPRSVIILISSRPDLLLPTIASRCLTLKFGRLSRDELAEGIRRKMTLPEEQIEELLLQARGSLNRALKIAEHGPDPKEAALWKFMAKGPGRSFSEIQELTKSIQQRWDEERKDQEANLRKEMKGDQVKDLSMVQRESMEKEWEGALSLATLAEGEAILGEVIHWFRDLEVLQQGGKPDQLLLPDQEKGLRHCLQQGKPPSLEKVLEIASEVKLAMERSTKASLCLEALLAKTCA